jgi:class 3 adenylate cyclase
MATCRTCGAESPDRYRFCGACGAPLDGVGVVEERKVVSVLFVDLVDFTRRSHAADPEDVRASLTLYFSRLKREIERYGGTVEKFIGDAVVAVFGVPSAHEDDAERAVRAALRIMEAIEEMNEAKPDLDLAARAAVDTGEVVVALGGTRSTEQGIVGNVMNTTARMQSAAPPGAVVVGEATYRSTVHFIHYEQLEPALLKGKPDPVPMWRALSARSRYGVDVGRSATPFVGRDFELAALDNAFDRVVRDRTLQLVTIVGEPGVGKTRLVAEFFTRVDNRNELVYWRQGRSLSYGDGISLWPLSEVVKAHAGILETDSATEARDKLAVAVAAVVDDAVDRDWLVARLGPLVGVEKPESVEAVDRQESFTAWTRFLEAVALRTPLVIVFEDLHWAGDTVLDFLDHLMEWAATAPLLLVCTARPELYEHRRGWGGGKHNSQTISLAPLSDEDSARLVDALVSRGALSQSLQGALLERAGGNPLYAEEFVRMLRDRGLLQSHPSDRAPEGAVDIPLPDSIHALIAARLDTLSLEHKALLHDASVLGKVFWVGALSEMAHSNEPSVVASLQELAGKEFVRRHRYSSIADQQEYSFRHGLIKDVAYAQIPRGGKALKHTAAAGWIEQIAGTRVRDHAELIAYHYHRSYQLAAREEGTELDDLRAVARQALVRAGERAMQLDVSKAEGYYSQALELSSQDRRERAVIAAGLVDASWLAGRITSSDAERAYEDAIDELLACDDRACAGEVMVKLSRVQWERGDRTSGRRNLARAVDVLEHEEPGPQLAFVYAQLAGEKWASGATSECLEWCDKTIALASKLGAEDQAIRARSIRGCARCDAGDLEGLEEVRRGLAQALEAGLGRETCIQYNNLGYLQWLSKGPSEAIRTYEEGIAFAEGRGLALEALWMRTSLEEALYDLGRWDEVVEIADETIARSQEHGYGEAMLAAAADKLQVVMRRAELDDAALLRPELLRQARDSGEAQLLVPALLVEALAEGTDRGSTVRELGEVVLADRSFEWLRHLSEVSRVLAGAGLDEMLEELLELVDTPYPRHRHSLATGRALLVEARRDHEAAARLYLEAASAWQRFGCALEHGHARLGAGRTLLRSGDRRAADESLRRARDAFSSLGARRLEHEALRLLQELEVDPAR